MVLELYRKGQGAGVSSTEEDGQKTDWPSTLCSVLNARQEQRLEARVTMRSPRDFVFADILGRALND